MFFYIFLVLPIKDIYIISTGHNPISQEHYNDTERVIILTTAFLPGAFKKGVLLVKSAASKLGARFKRIFRASDIVSELVAKTKDLGWSEGDKSFQDLAEVIKSLRKNNKLPENYLTSEEAKKLGWVSTRGNLADVAPGKMIGGEIYKNNEKLLPPDKTYLKADLGYVSGFRGTERVVYSSDGKKIYVTNKHYKIFEEIQ